MNIKTTSLALMTTSKNGLTFASYEGGEYIELKANGEVFDVINVWDYAKDAPKTDLLGKDKDDFFEIVEDYIKEFWK